MGCGTLELSIHAFLADKRQRRAVAVIRMDVVDSRESYRICCGSEDERTSSRDRSRFLVGTPLW